MKNNFTARKISLMRGKISSLRVKNFNAGKVTSMQGKMTSMHEKIT
jgi:hypothetical protein